MMSEGLRNDLKNVFVCFSGILNKTIDFHESVLQENEFFNKWRLKFGLFFMGTLILAVFKFPILQQPQIWSSLFVKITCLVL